jgi:hypothetical protein
MTDLPYPNLWTLRGLASWLGRGSASCEVQIDAQWYPARPTGYRTIWSRLSVAWMVFTGKADALVWPGGQ